MINKAYNEKIYDRNNTMINPGDMLAWKPGGIVKYTAIINGKGKLEAVAIGNPIQSLPKFSSEMMRLMVVLEEKNVYTHR